MDSTGAVIFLGNRPRPEHHGAMRPALLLLAACLTAIPVPVIADPGSFDCARIPEAPVEINDLGEAGPRGSHDLAFDSFGYLTGYDGFSIVRGDRSGDRRVLASMNFGGEGPEGMEYLPDGRLVSAAPMLGIFTVSPEGDVVLLAPDLRDVFGVLLGPDGLLYAGDNHCLYRVDPGTAEVERLLCSEDHDGPEPFTPRIVNFNLDFSEMFVGTHENRLFRVPIDARLDPVGAPVFWLEVAGSTSGVDGLEVDVCGNLYVPTYPDGLYRITPEGLVRLYHQWAGVLELGHGLRFGTGRHGWRDDALYLPRFYGGNTIVEVVTGVPGRRMPRRSLLSDDDAHALLCRATPGRRGKEPRYWLPVLALLLLTLRRRSSNPTGDLS